MKTPMILPWLAKKAGISDEKAEVLWHQALRHATLKSGWVNTPEYWRIANEKLLELVQAEGNKVCRPNLVPMVRIQHRLGEIPFLAWEGMMRATSEAWHRFHTPGRHAH
jgi:hypothetical protein